MIAQSLRRNFQAVLVSGFAATAMILPSAAQAATIVYNVILSGAAEAPPNASPGTGFGVITFDTTANTMRVDTTFSDLIGTTTVAHIHCCTTIPGVATAGVATQTPSFAGFPAGVTSGSYDHTFDMTLASSWNATFITANGGTTAGAFAALLAGAASGRAYLNIHSSFAPAGEIRGFLAAETPLPAALPLFATGLGALGIAGWRRRRKAGAAA
jgi:hypothetical protein